MRPFHMLAPGVSAWVDLDHIQLIDDVELREADVEPCDRRFVTELMPPAGFYIQYAFRDMKMLYGVPTDASPADVQQFCQMHAHLVEAWKNQ